MNTWTCLAASLPLMEDKRFLYIFNLWALRCSVIIVIFLLSSFLSFNLHTALQCVIHEICVYTLESGRWTPQLSKEQQVIRCCVTDGTTEEFSGKCVIVYRLKSNVEFGIKQLLDVNTWCQPSVFSFSLLLFFWKRMVVVFKSFIFKTLLFMLLFVLFSM